MDQIRTLLARIASLFRRGKLDAELDEEVRAHIDLAIEENLRGGMSSQQARTAALRSFGGMTQTKEAYRTRRGLPWIETLVQDLHFGARTLGKSPGFTAIAVLTLALGIGGNTAVFSIVNGVLLNPLPFPHSEQLVTLDESKPNFPQGSISYPNFLDWQRDNRSFSSMAIARSYSFNMTGRGNAEQVNGEYISPEMLSLLDVHPLLGRNFTRDDNQSGAGPVALIGEGLWRRKFDATPAILGQPVTLDGKSYSIIGVIPASFHLRFSNFREQYVYTPIGQWSNPYLLNRAFGLGVHGIARLRPGVTVEQARTDMDRITRNLALAFPDADMGIGASISPLQERMVGDTRPFLMVLLAAVGFVLLIACVNVASLLLARSARRSREFAVRVALGASRARVICQLLTENLLLAIAAGALGLLLAAWGTHAGLKLLPAALPRAEEVGLDFRVLAFTLTISLLTGTISGLAPALASRQATPHAALKEGGRSTASSHQRALGTFVVIEMAVALVLLIGAGLMTRTLVRLWNVDPGFNPHNVLTFGLSLPPSMMNASPERIRAAFRAVDARLAATPGIKAVSLMWGAAPMGGDDERSFWFDGQARPASDQDMKQALAYVTEPDYLRIMQIPLKRGRFFTQQDDEHSPRVAVIDEAFASKYFPNQDPIGKRIRTSDTGNVVEIVGEVAHVKQWGLDLDDMQPLHAQIYLASMQMPDSFIAITPSGSSMVVRYEGNLAAVLDSLRRANRQMSSEQVIYGDQTMESVISDTMVSRRFAMILLGAFAGLAMALACIGIYGVTTYLVSQRTQEMGIRMALGAQRRDVLALVLWGGARLTLIGVAVGIGASLVLTRLMHSLLFNVSPTDPAILIGVSLLLVLVALTACAIPAARASSIDPMRALRTE